MARVGSCLEQFLVPIEPGSLMMLGYAGHTAIVSAPGCFRSTRRNALDVVLPPLLARHRVTACELASLGTAGLHD
jgi:molybdenum cofactor cytidylyltransferase